MPFKRRHQGLMLVTQICSSVALLGWPVSGGYDVFCLEIADEILQAICGVINPVKLAHLGRLTGLWEPRRRS